MLSGPQQSPLLLNHLAPIHGVNICSVLYSFPPGIPEQFPEGSIVPFLLIGKRPQEVSCAEGNLSHDLALGGSARSTWPEEAESVELRVCTCYWCLSCQDSYRAILGHSGKTEAKLHCGSTSEPSQGLLPPSPGACPIVGTQIVFS